MQPASKIHWSSFGRTHVGGVRKINQDAFANFPSKCLWLVADGMGGHKDGGIASNAIVDAFKQFEAEKMLGATNKKIYQQLSEVNDRLISQAAMTGQNDVIGSTVVILYAKLQSCVVLWSGDSRLYLFRRDQLRQITQDHNNESSLLSKGLSSEEVASHPYAQVLTHAIGGEPEAYLDAQIQEIRDKDIFLLCSDGLNKEVSDHEIENVLVQMPCQQAMDSLMELSLQRGGRDNITLVIAQANIR